MKRMDNPALASQRQEDFSESIAGMASGLSSGDRIPLVVYRVYVSDGHEELARGERMTGVNLRLLRNIAGIGDDFAVFNYMQNAAPGFAGTALGAFGNAQGGVAEFPGGAFTASRRSGSARRPRRPPAPAPGSSSAASVILQFRTHRAFPRNLLDGSHCDEGDLRPAQKSNGQVRHTQTSADVHPRLAFDIPTLQKSSAAAGQPIRPDKGNPDLPAVRMSRQAEVHLSRSAIEEVWRVEQSDLVGIRAARPAAPRPVSASLSTDRPARSARRLDESAGSHSPANARPRLHK